mmetsp:Transcript_4717/g.11348  ORF Transcript_4717/g.11348 Transcript_4717/m.11348 type:complete len:96 (+) Transcript_4717:2-289(+)
MAAACSNAEDDTVEMVGIVGSSMSHAKFADAVAGSETFWKARCVYLPSLIASNDIDMPQLALIKIDIEGGESSIVPPLIKWLETRRYWTWITRTN